MDPSVTEHIVTPGAVGCMMMAAITLYTAGFHLAIFSSRRREKTHAVFALTCAGIAAYDIFCAGLYESASTTEGMAWQRLQLFAIAFVSVCMMWLVFIITERRIGVLFKCLASWFAGLQLLSLVVPDELSLAADRPALKHTAIPGLLRVTYHEVELGAVHLLGLASCVLTYAYLLFLLLEYRRRAARGVTLWMIVSQCSFFAGVINDSLVGAGAYSFVYVAEYVFFAIVLAMSSGLLAEFVQARAAVEHMNDILDRRVTERTRDLELATQAATFALAELKQKDERLAANIEQARVFQEKTLSRPPAHADVGIHYQPLETVSGDTFDICELGPARLRIFLADVTGHGVQAAMRTTLLKTEYDRVKFAHADAASVLETLNRRLVELFPDGEMMSTAVCLDVLLQRDGAHGTLSNAGGPDPLLCSSAGATEKTGTATYLGVHQEGWPPALHFPIALGNTIVLYTDGLSEQFNADRSRFDPARAAGELGLPDTAGDLVQRLMAAFHEFRGSVAVADDLTIIALRIPSDADASHPASYP
jgi:serine phosphatase RsbU (regulator of sigma subunit)